MMKYFLPILAILLSLVSCMHHQHDECKKLQHDSDLKIFRFYHDSSRHHLDSALNDLEKAYQLCPELETVLFPNMKVSLLWHLKQYKRAYAYVDSFPDSSLTNDFPCSKNGHLNFYSAYIYREQKDTVKMDSCVHVVLKELDDYLIIHPEHERFVVLQKFHIKYIFQDKSKVIHEIEALRNEKEYDEEFIESLITEVMENPFAIE